MRGAVSIALAFNQFTIKGVTSDPVNAAMITNTVVVVLFTTLVFGFLTRPLINFLLPHLKHGINIHLDKDEPDEHLPLLSSEGTTGILQVKRSLSALLERPVHTIHAYWRKFDDSYMRPIFGGPS
ncbi:hypothetical protein J5N97_005392 [Dioscorea zingiberensis]|uniref:Na+/H+ antiporter n=1 Tax=Dioscorea zingiberensis TaxID=325984 RepID=A0A9D5D818_9LILI|nr:hypothetical protein J5N97_005392 [Dioscorea zingiberensis]